MNSQVRASIARNIDEYGYHVYVVTGGPTPRWVYTIGLSESIGFELVAAGAILYSAVEVREIINLVVGDLTRDARTESVQVAKYGGFRLSSVHEDWSSQLLLGAHDYYQNRFDVVQLVPDHEHRTIDVPDLSSPLVAGSLTPWRWLVDEWPYAISKKSEAMTDIDALRGARVTEAARWEEDYWEVFAASRENVNKDDARLVPLGMLLAMDSSLEPIVELGLGSGVWREANGPWRNSPKAS